MVDDAHAPGSNPDPVIPPPPAAPPADSAPPVPLAPPVGGPPAPPLPPYAVGSQPAQYPAPQPGQYPAPQPGQYPAPQPGQYPAGQQPTAPYGAEYPYPAAPPNRPSSSGKTVGIVIAAVAAFVLIVVVGIGVAVSLVVSSRTEPATAPRPTSITEEPAAPSSPPQADPDSDDPDADASGIEATLQAKIDEYKRLRDSGALWQSIPDTEFNRTAVSAFLYFLVDMKSATLWGVDEAQAQEYQERMTMLEERLLAQQPLGDDIKITLEDKVFTYDGETGEGGYTDK